MGNKIGKRRQVVDEQYTRPQGLYQHRDVDHKKLRKLILDAKLAPCYPGDEECALDLEECPICFLYYPSLNRSRCCMKGICTECFLQMKPHNSTRPIQCPFCKTSTYAVEYRGVRTKEEKGVEQLEEQRVIEAHIRMRRQELQDEEERMQKRQEMSSSIRMESSVEAEYQDMSSNSLSVPSSRHSIQGDDLVSSEALCSMLASRKTSHPRPNRYTIFATHMEGLTEVATIYPNVKMIHFVVDLRNNRLDFKFNLKDGPRHLQQYGLLLAGVTGLPSSVVEMARNITARITEKVVAIKQPNHEGLQGSEESS